MRPLTAGVPCGNEYDNVHSCTITPLKNGYLDVVSLATENYFDYLTVPGYGSFDGTTGPNGAYVTTSDPITFYADYSITEDGFHICMSSTFTDTLNPWPTQSPTITCDPATHFTSPRELPRVRRLHSLTQLPRRERLR